jgi:hypothetical protein
LESKNESLQKRLDISVQTKAEITAQRHIALPFQSNSTPTKMIASEPICSDRLSP